MQRIEGQWANPGEREKFDLDIHVGLPFLRPIVEETDKGFTVDLNLSDAAPIGTIRDILQIRIKEHREIRIPVFADVYGEIHLKPRSF